MLNIAVNVFNLITGTALGLAFVILFAILIICALIGGLISFVKGIAG